MRKISRVEKHRLEGFRPAVPGEVTSGVITLAPPDLAARLKGLYDRVARELDLDASYVSRAARGECRSQAIEEALRRELESIANTMNEKHEGPSRSQQQESEDNKTARQGKREIKVRRFRSR